MRAVIWFSLAVSWSWLSFSAIAQGEFPRITQQPLGLTLAPGSTATFAVIATGDEPLSYQWYFDLLTPIPDGTNATLTVTNVQPTDAGSYQVVITNLIGVVNSVEAWLEVKFPPAILENPVSQTVTQGNTVSFTAVVSGDEVLHYQWYFNTTHPVPNGTNLTLELPSAQSSDVGTYFLQVTNEVGIATTSEATLEVRLPPIIITQPTNLTVLVGQPAEFSVSVSGDEPIGFQWYFDETNEIAGANGPILDLAAAQLADSGTYSIVVTNPVGTVNSASARLRVLALPEIIEQPVSLIVTQGHTASFAVTASGTPSPDHQWYFNETNLIAGATGTSLTLPSAQFFDAGAYSVVVSNEAGVVVSSPAMLTVRVPPAILQHPTSRVIAPGKTITFSVVALGDAPLSYQWLFNTTNEIANATDSTLQITNVQAEVAGDYSVVVANGVGSVTSLVATLTLKQPPTILEQPASLSVTSGSPAAFTVLVGGDGPFGYSWFFNATNLIAGANDPTLTLLNTQISVAGTYTVLVTNDAGSVLSAPATLSIRLAPSIIQHPVNTAATPGSTPIFTVVATGDLPLRYQWFSNLTNLLSGETNSALALTNVQATAEGTYSVVVVNDIGSTASIAALLRVRNPVFIQQEPNSLTVTQGHDATFAIQAGGDGPFTYQWYFNTTNLITSARSATLVLSNVQPAHAGFYSVRLTNLVSFAASTEAELTVRLVPTITQQPAGVIRTPGSEATFSVAVTGEEPFTYQWFFNATNAVPDATNSTLVLADLQFSDAGPYSVTISNPVGTATSAEAVLAVQLPPTIATQPASLVTTQGHAASFTVEASGDGPFTYQWYFDGDMPIPNSNGDTLLLAAAQAVDAGIYSVRVSNAVGSVLSDGATLAVKLWPVLALQPTSMVVTQGQTAVLSVTAESEEPVAFQWRRNGEEVSGATSSTWSLINIQPDDAGTYDVVVWNNFGSAISTVAEVTVFGLDFGDAPDPEYPTYLANDGARHVIIPGMHLGFTADPEPDGQPTLTAFGDDLSDGVDENGVHFISPFRVGQSAQVEVVASTTGLINAWIDWDQADGWTQSDEQVITNHSVGPGTNLITIVVPAEAAPGATFARFRFSTASDLSPAGLAPDGEVEDYPLAIQASADLTLSQSVSAPRVTVGSNATFTVNVTNLGPTSVTGVVVTERLPSRTAFVSATPTQGACGHTNGVVTCNLGALTSGARADIAIVARIGAGTNTLTASVTAAEFDPNTANNTASSASVGTLNLPVGSNTEPIILPVDDPGPGSLYPSVITISGATSSVYKVTVTVRDINHSYPDDIDILLVGPRGQKVLLMSDTGLDNEIVDVSLTFDDDATQSLPDSDPPIVPGTYRPTNFGTTSDGFEAPAPPAPYVTNLAVFRGTNPNGAWSLYVRDDQPLNANPQGGDPGFVALGWSLSITTGDPIADLFISQSAQPNPVIVGSNLTYTINVTNRGSAITTAVISNPLAPGVNFVSASSPVGNCSVNAGIVTCDLGSLESGVGTRITLTVAPTLGGPITNVVTVSGNQLDLAPADNTASLVTTVIPVAELSLTTVSAPSDVLLSQPVQHSLTVSNSGPNVATGVVVTNFLASGVNFLSATPSQGSCTNQGGVVVCSLGTLPVAAGASIQISGLPTSVGVSSNYATVTAVPLDFDSTNNSAASVVTVNPSADLILTALTPSAKLSAGADFVTVITVSNRGPNTANVQLVDPLPALVSFASASSTRGSCSFTNGIVLCDLLALAPGETAMATVTARTSASGSITNTISVIGSVGDINPANNSATNVVLIVPAADLTLHAVARPDPLWLGENLVYTLTVTNRGPNAAGTVLLTNQLPPGVTYLATTWTQGACSRLGSEISCNLGPLSAGAFATVTVSIRPVAPGFISNTAQVASELADANPANNQATLTTRVLTSSGSFTNSGAIEIALAGQATPYPSTIFVSGLTASVFQVRVILTNLTHSYADDLDILLVGPGGRTALLMSDAGGDSALNNVTLTLDDGALGVLPDAGFLGTGSFRPANYEFTADVFPAPAPPGPYGTNLSTFAGIDPNGTWSLYVMDDADKDSGALGGWRLTFSTLEPIADVLVAQTLSANPVAVSSNLVFRYSVTNRGPSAAINVRLTNALPAQLQDIVFTTSTGTCNLTGGTLNCALGTLPVGGFASIIVSGTSLATGTGSNVVSVISDLLDVQPANNRQSTLIVFENPPIITLHPVSQIVTNGGSVLFTAGAIGDPPFVYQWQRNGVNLIDATNAALTIENVIPNNAGAYRLRVNNRVGVALSDQAILTVTGPPTISDLADLTIAEDTDTGLIPFTVQDFETPADTLTVLGDSSNHAIVPPEAISFSGTDVNRTLRIAPSTNQFGQVIILVIARDPDGASTTNRFSLTVTPVIDLITVSLPPQNSMAKIGATVPFSVAASSALPLTYQWQRNGIDLPGAISDELALPDVQLTDGGTIRVLISNADTSIFSPAAQLLVVAEPPNPTILSITQDGSNVNISFTTIVGATYTLEYKTSLSEPDWTESGSTIGDGGVAILTDIQQGDPNRFYRIRAE
jgi:uncharacterized repeat protein (TIGR01451 family)